MVSIFVIGILRDFFEWFLTIKTLFCDVVTQLIEPGTRFEIIV